MTFLIGCIATVFVAYYLSSLAAWKILKCAFGKCLLYVFINIVMSHGIDLIMRKEFFLTPPITFIGFPVAILFGSFIFKGVFGVSFVRAMLAAFIVEIIYTLFLIFLGFLIPSYLSSS